jgi:hypothetical protein
MSELWLMRRRVLFMFMASTSSDAPATIGALGGIRGDAVAEARYPLE